MLFYVAIVRYVYILDFVYISILLTYVLLFFRSRRRFKYGPNCSSSITFFQFFFGVNWRTLFRTATNRSYTSKTYSSKHRIVSAFEHNFFADPSSYSDKTQLVHCAKCNSFISPARTINSHVRLIQLTSYLAKFYGLPFFKPNPVNEIFAPKFSIKFPFSLSSK